MDLFAPHPQLANHFLIHTFPARDIKPRDADKQQWNAAPQPEIRHRRSRRSSRRNHTGSASHGMSSMHDAVVGGASSMEEADDWLIPGESLGLEQTTAATPLGFPQRKTSLITDPSIELAKEFLVQNAILLAVACAGAFVLFAINCVGIFICKGYFKRKEPQNPLSMVGLYPQSLSHSRRCRYHTILRRFSLESGSHSQHDSHSGAQPPVVGPLSMGETQALAGGMAGGMAGVCVPAGPGGADMRRRANDFAVLEVPEIVTMPEAVTGDVIAARMGDNIEILDNIRTDGAVVQGSPPRSEPPTRGWRERLKVTAHRKHGGAALAEGAGNIRGGVCSLIKSANGNTAVLPKHTNIISNHGNMNGIHRNGGVQTVSQM